MIKTQYSKITKVVMCVFVSNTFVGLCLMFYHIITRDYRVVGIGFLIATMGIISICASYYMRDKLGKWPHKYHLSNTNDGNDTVELAGTYTTPEDAAIAGLDDLGWLLIKEEYKYD